MIQRNNLTITKADNSKTMVIINKDTLKQKFNTFIQESHITCLNKDPTDCYQKQIQQAFKKYDILIDKTHTQIPHQYKTSGTQTQGMRKTHKGNEPFRPTVNNIQAPSYKIAKYLKEILNNLVCLPCKCTRKNSQEINSPRTEQYSDQ
jgi:hypothetical protein